MVDGRKERNRHLMSLEVANSEGAEYGVDLTLPLGKHIFAVRAPLRCSASLLDLFASSVGASSAATT